MRVMLFSLVLATVASAQPATEAGRVVGVVVEAETGEPLPGVNVRLPGTTLGAATDIDGRFVIESVPAGEYEVEAVYVGAEPWRATVRVEAGATVSVWPEVEFVALCDCVIVTTPPESISRSVYQARVVEYEEWRSDCCRAWRERRDVPLAHWESR